MRRRQQGPVPLLDDMDPAINEDTEAEGQQEQGDEGSGVAQENAGIISPNDPAILRDITETTQHSHPSSATGARPKQKAPSIRESHDANLGSDRHTAVLTLNAPAASNINTSAGILSASVPNPPFSSYFEKEVTEDDIIPHFDRRIFEGVKDTPPLIRKARQIIAKYQPKKKD